MSRVEECILRIFKAKICFTACDQCMGDVVRQMRTWDDIKFARGSVIARDLDHVYIKWLSSGKQNLVKLNCPHATHDRPQHRYYIPGRARLHLGLPIQPGIYDYWDAGLVLKPRKKIRRKLIRRYTYLQEEDDSDSDLSYYSSDDYNYY